MDSVAVMDVENSASDNDIDAEEELESMCWRFSFLNNLFWLPVSVR